MKRFMTLMLAFALVVGAVSTSAAADIKAKGQMDFAFQWTDNTDFQNSKQDNNSEDDFAAMQRVRTQIDIVASENLAGVLFFEIGTQNWGSSTQGAALGTDGVNIETRRAFIDFTVPTSELNVRMGLQNVALPSAALGNPILDDDAAALVLSHPIGDMGTVTAFWARLADTNVGGNKGNRKTDEFDVFGTAVALDFDVVKVSPYVAYAKIGKDATKAKTVNGVSTQVNYINGSAGSAASDATAFWAGTSLEVDVVENLFFDLDVAYSKLKSDTASDESKGWFVASKLGYKMDYFTPVLLGWYSSGNDDNKNNGSERFVTVSGSGLGATSFGTDGAFFDTKDSILTGNGMGTWGVGAALQDISFVEDLSHVIRVAYIKGTDAEKLAAKDFDEKSSAWEVNLDTKYQIYENLSACVELGWIKRDIKYIEKESNAWKAAVGFTYSF